jgi:hypothetical protein
MRAFAGTLLETLELSPGLVSIGYEAFSCPALREIDFRAGASGARGLSIESAFANCGELKNARLPDNLDSLLATFPGSFGNCSALELLSIPATTNSVSVDTARESKNIRFEVRGAGKFGTALEGRVLTQLGGAVWITAPGLGGGEIEVPEGVIELAEGGFFANNTELRGITLPSTLTVINDRLFQGCSALERVTINGAISSIGLLAFMNCSSLGSIDLPESLRYIGENAFKATGLRSIVVPSNVEEYGSMQCATFADCHLLEYADIRTPHLSELMFMECRELKEIRLAPETKEIPYGAFRNCVKLEKINYGENRNINLPPALEVIRFQAFLNCAALRGELEIPPGFKAIEYVSGQNMGPFYGCLGITRLILPRSLEGDLFNAFAGLDSLGSFGVNGTGEVLKVSPEGKLLIQGDKVILTAGTLGTVTIPAGVRNYAKLAGDTSLTGLVFEADPGRSSIPENAFSGCTNLVRVVLSSSVQVINDFAFNGCRSLEELVITNDSSTSLTTPVVKEAFRNCESLASIKVPPALVDAYKAEAKWHIKPPGVYNASFLDAIIIADNR